MLLFGSLHSQATPQCLHSVLYWPHEYDPHRCVLHHPGGPFFTPRLEKAVANLRPHIEKGCISDLPSERCTSVRAAARSTVYRLSFGARQH